MEDSTKRFSDRVDNYVKYRPTYSREMLQSLTRQCDLKKSDKIADVGAGTGIFTQLLLEEHYEVFAVEPNKEMRVAAEKSLGSSPLFHSVNGTAEHTSLPNHSINLVTAAQAFHWFDPPNTKTEFARILKPGGKVALIWNNRESTTEFGADYEHFLDVHGTGYAEVKSEWARAEAVLESFFAPAGYEHTKFPNHQDLDWDGLWGRFQSSSYSPKPGHPKYEPAEKALREIFADHQQNNLIRMGYLTETYVG